CSASGGRSLSSAVVPRDVQRENFSTSGRVRRSSYDPESPGIGPQASRRTVPAIPGRELRLQARDQTCFVQAADRGIDHQAEPRLPDSVFFLDELIRARPPPNSAGKIFSNSS